MVKYEDYLGIHIFFKVLILEFGFGPNSTPKASSRSEGCPTFINTVQAISLSNVGLSTHPLTPRTGHLEREVCRTGHLRMAQRISIGSDTILEFGFRPNSIPKASSWSEGCPPTYNYYSGHITIQCETLNKSFLLCLSVANEQYE